MKNFQNTFCFFSDKRLKFNLSNVRHPNKLSKNLLSNVLEHRNKFFTLENGKKLMLNASTIPWISEELLQSRTPTDLIICYKLAFKKQ